MNNSLTARQSEVLEFMKAQHRQSGLIPSTREIQEHFGFASQTAAMSHLKALEKKGAITRLAGKARAVIFADQESDEGSYSNSTVNIPLFGMIPAGLGSDQEQQNDGYVSLDASVMKVSETAQKFALKVRGESMIDAHIMDGDIVIVEVRQANAVRDGDIVAALIDGESTLKRLVMKKEVPWLKAENAQFPDLHPLEDLQVQGVMVALMRGANSIAA